MLIITLYPHLFMQVNTGNQGIDANDPLYLSSGLCFCLPMLIAISRAEPPNRKRRHNPSQRSACDTHGQKTRSINYYHLPPKPRGRKNFRQKIVFSRSSRGKERLLDQYIQTVDRSDFCAIDNPLACSLFMGRGALFTLRAYH